MKQCDRGHPRTGPPGPDPSVAGLCDMAQEPRYRMYSREHSAPASTWHDLCLAEQGPVPFKNFGVACT